MYGTLAAVLALALGLGTAAEPAPLPLGDEGSDPAVTRAAPEATKTKAPPPEDCEGCLLAPDDDVTSSYGVTVSLSGGGSAGSGECSGTVPECTESPCSPSDNTLTVNNGSSAPGSIWVAEPGASLRIEIPRGQSQDFEITSEEPDMDCGTNRTMLKVYDSSSGGNQIGKVWLICSDCT